VDSLGLAVSGVGIPWRSVSPGGCRCPRRQGLWWPVSELARYAILAGVLFHRLAARGLLEDLQHVKGSDAAQV